MLGATNKMALHIHIRFHIRVNRVSRNLFYNTIKLTKFTTGKSCLFQYSLSFHITRKRKGWNYILLFTHDLYCDNKIVKIYPVTKLINFYESLTVNRK